MIDSHAHLDSSRYSEDREQVLARAYEAGVRTILSIGIGDGPETMHRALELAEEHAGKAGVPALFASAGIHPSEAALADDKAYEKLVGLLGNRKLIAVGEIGLDYYHAENPARAVQSSAFIQQMEIAASYRKPIIIHCRAADPVHSAGENARHDAWEDTLQLLEQHWRPTGLGGILHCFGGTREHAARGLDLGFCISFAGNITFPKAQPLRDLAAWLPPDRLLIETDCPFLAPMPYRGERNEPAYVGSAAQTIAQARETSREEIEDVTTENFHQLFGRTAMEGM